MAADPKDALLQLAIAKLGADTPTAQSLLRLAVVLAQDANKLPGLKGKERLELVLSALRGMLEVPAVKEKIGADAEKVLKDVIDNVIPETITLVVEASRGGFTLKKPSVGCVASLAALLCRTVAATAPAGSEIAAVAASAAAVASSVATEEPAAAPAAAPEPTPEPAPAAALELREPTTPAPTSS